MADKPTDETTQETPKGHKIPVPSKQRVMDDLQKIAKPKRRLRLRRPKK